MAQCSRQRLCTGGEEFEGPKTKTRGGGVAGGLVGSTRKVATSAYPSTPASSGSMGKKTHPPFCAHVMSQTSPRSKAKNRLLKQKFPANLRDSSGRSSMPVTTWPLTAKTWSYLARPRWSCFNICKIGDPKEWIVFSRF